MSELIGPLGFPGAIAALFVAAFFGVKIMGAVKAPNGTGEWRGRMEAVVSHLQRDQRRLTDVVEQVADTQRDVVNTQREISQALLKQSEALRQIDGLLRS